MKIDADIGAIRSGVRKYLDWLEQNQLAMWDVMPQANQGDDPEAVIDFILNVVSDTLNVSRVAMNGGPQSTTLDSTDPEIRAAVHQELIAGEYLGEVTDFQRRALSEVGHTEVRQSPDKLTDKTTGIQEIQMSPETDVPSDEERRSELLSIYSDTYKEIEGIRPRWIWDEYKDAPIEEIEVALGKLYDRADAEHEREDPEEAHQFSLDSYDFQDQERSRGLPHEDEVHPGEKSPRVGGMGQRGRPRIKKFNRRTENRLRGVIRTELNNLNEVYNTSLSDNDTQPISNAIWNTLDVEVMVEDITRRCINAYNGAKRESEARTRMINVINKGLMTQAEALADAIMGSVRN